MVKVGTMDTPVGCPQCGQLIPPDASGGLCPLCLLVSVDSSLDTATLEADRLWPGSSGEERVVAEVLSFGDYRIEREIARGGMGVVYLARQPGLDRVVALKMIQFGSYAGEVARDRFLAEARLTARLKHPRIVGIHDIGILEGQPYFTMDWIDGPNLAQALQSGPWSAQRAALLARELASALVYAHAQGVIHRDLKPSNILLDAEGLPHITDFGLAKHLGSDTELTRSGQTIGSPSYMAPEQVREAGKADGRNDIYGLGALLYHALTGRPPFQGPTPAEVLTQVQERDPVPPRQLDPSIPPDLETLCLKCLEKDPARRYATAQELADELERFLCNEPILARPITTAERSWRWCRRKPALAAAILGCLLLVSVLVVGGPLMTLRIDRLRAEAVRQRSHAETEAQLARDEALRAHQSAYAADMLLVENALTEGNLSTAAEMLKRYEPTAGATDLRGWEWRYGVQQTQGEQLAILGRHDRGAVVASGFLGDPGTVWSAGEDQTVRLWNLASRREVARFEQEGPLFDATLSPDGQTLAFIVGRAFWPGNYPVRLQKLPGQGREPARLLTTSLFPRKTMQFSAGGRWLAFQEVNLGLRLFEVETGIETRLPTFRDKIHPLGFAFGPRDWLAYAFDQSGAIRIYSLSGRTNVAELRGHSGVVQHLVFTPDGRNLVSASLDATVRFWQTENWREASKLANQHRYTWPILFSPTGDRFLPLAGALNIYETSTGTRTRELRGHLGDVPSASFHPDGRWILSGGADGSLRLWDARAEADPAKFVAMPRNLMVQQNRSDLFSLSPDGQHLITIIADGTFGVERLIPPVASGKRISLGTTHIYQEAVANGGELAAFVVKGNPSERELLVFDVVGEREVFRAPLLPPDGRMVFAPDSGRVAVGSWPVVQVFDVRTHRETQRLRCTVPEAGLNILHDLTFSSDGRRFAAASGLGWAYLWEPALSDTSRAVRVTDLMLESVAFSPDGRVLAAGGWGLPNALALIDAQTGQLLPTLSPNLGAALTSSISPDGRTLAVSEGAVISLWNMASRKLVGHLRGHRQDIQELRFLPDNRSLVSVSQEEWRIWNAAPEETTRVVTPERN